jgi:hypothetical protein
MTVLMKNQNVALKAQRAAPCVSDLKLIRIVDQVLTGKRTAAALQHRGGCFLLATR